MALFEVPEGFGRGGRLRSQLAPVEWAACRMTAGLRLQPDFLIIGAQKAGTTSLCSHLFSHPQVLASRRKEVHYFDSPEFKRGIGWYRAHFASKQTANEKAKTLGHPVITGEASPYYLTHPSTPRRVYEALPDVKLIVMLRNPVDRTLSHYNHQVGMKREPLSFEAAIEAEEERLQGELERMLADENYYSHNYWAYSYLARSRYAEQIERWLEFFPKEQLLVIGSERFFSKPHEEFQRTLDYLGLERLRLDSYRKQNTGEYDGMSASLREKLSEYFRQSNEALYAMTNEEFCW